MDKKKFFSKENICTIPNLLSLIRIIMVPFILWLYIGLDNHVGAFILTALSGLTDLFDGIIARKFNQISDLGKILDPIGDKLTQAALIICLIFKYKWFIWLFVLFAIKEITQGILAYFATKKSGVVEGANYFGKVSTFVFYFVVAALFIFTCIPETVAMIMAIVCGALMLIAFVAYTIIFVRQIKKSNTAL